MKVRFSEQTGSPKMNPKITKILKKGFPGSLRFGPQNGPQNVGFSLQKKVFGANGVPKNEPEKAQKVHPGPGPILLPSVAPYGTPPAMLLKKLAFEKKHFNSL